jgi:hypothetical protein
MTTTAYCTILSSNYLPKALALAESLRRHHDGAGLRILFIDIPDDAGLPTLDGVECLSTASLGLSDRRILHLATIYDLVELATAVKPLLLQRLLETHDHVVYLDPDTYVTSPMGELGPALDATDGGILVTPHFLRPPGRDAELTDGHMLAVGVNNLGFCAVDRRSGDFLDWWWGHLVDECLFEPLSGLFVDQKWVDLGSSLFQAGSFRHAGYNVGVANLPERPLARDAEGYLVSSTGERLRLFHFHAFDSSQPEKLSVRFRHNEAGELGDDDVLRALCKEYAEVLTTYEQSLPEAPLYPYRADQRGKHLWRQLRRAYRLEADAGAELPSPFVAADADAFARWRRRAKRTVARALLSDAAKCLRIVLPEEYDRVKDRYPRLAARLHGRFGEGTGTWG